MAPRQRSWQPYLHSAPGELTLVETPEIERLLARHHARLLRGQIRERPVQVAEPLLISPPILAEASATMATGPSRSYAVDPMPVPQITWRQIQEQSPEDNRLREAIGGELYVTPAPSIRHQRPSKRLERALLRLLDDPGHGEVFDAPTGVEFPVTGEGAEQVRFADRLPVRLREEVLGEVDLREVFRRG